MQIRIWKSALLLPALLLGLAATGCSEDPVTPSGNDTTDVLSARVNDLSYNFGITSSFSQYDLTSKRGEFGGTITGSPARTLRVSFILDLDTAKLPQTLHDPNVGITYSTLATGDTAFYDCGILTTNCQLTVTSRNGDRVNGTFSATLVNQKDTTKKVTITSGQFSASLKRM